MSMPAQQSGQRRRSWFGRHQLLAHLRASTGFLAGYLPGDDGVFYDLTAEFNRPGTGELNRAHSLDMQ
jgi:hypothetical protein